MSDVRTALPRYVKILKGEEEPWFILSKRFPIETDIGETLESRSEVHDNAVKRLKGGEDMYYEVPDFSLLDLKVQIAKDMLSSCKLCERRCAVNRVDRKRGHCGVLEPRISSEFLHYGEEPELVPSNTIFFSGCTFNCVFCQNWDISQNPGGGEHFTPGVVSDIISRRKEVARNVNWVGGDPTSNLPFILEVMQQSSSSIAQVWNSNMYLTEDSMRLLDGVIDVYLTDFKYGNDECAKRLSGIENYWNVTTRNHLAAKEQCEVIIRHLVLPNHVECCSKPILSWIADNLGDKVRVNVMAQYRPQYQASKHPDIDRRPTRYEFMEAWEYARALKLNLME